MITSLEIRGFKRFESESFELRPLTVLTGVNGGGKSTMIQSLLLARLAGMTGTSGTTMGGTVRLNGPLGLALGEARDVVNWTSDAREITVRLGGAEGESWVYGFGLPDSGQALHLEVTRLPVALVPGIGPRVMDPAFTYLCAERLGPRDTLSVSAEAPDRIGVGVRGEFTAQVLALRESRAVGTRRAVRRPLHHPEAAGSQLRVQAEAWASEIIRPLRINARVAVGIMAGTIRFGEAGLSGEEIRPSNTGFGVSYALPVIVAGLLTEPGDLLIVENPEAHLHPAGQSRLGRFLARVAGSGVQVLVETHSDHVLNGARLAVAQDHSLPAKDMITHYFDHDRALPIGINAKGELSHWPSGFFDQIETDLGRLARARRGR